MLENPMVMGTMETEPDETLTCPHCGKVWDRVGDTWEADGAIATEKLPVENYQGNAVINYTDRETPYTRIIEHKWFTFGQDAKGNTLPTTVISREYSTEWHPGVEPYYPVNDELNGALCRRYLELASREEHVTFGGRLGAYRYYDMDAVIAEALACAARLLQSSNT